MLVIETLLVFNRLKQIENFRRLPRKFSICPYHKLTCEQECFRVFYVIILKIIRYLYGVIKDEQN